jgi:sulfate transport system ATP-binding protein
VRPHELEIDRHPPDGPSRRARVVHVSPAGAVARVELPPADGAEAVHVEVSPARLAELPLEPGDAVFVAPRKVRVFVPDYAI